MTKPVFVVSDVHLGAVPASTERAFRDFLDYAVDSASSLVINGDLFGHVLAMSPGFMVNPHPVGKPKIFVTHGTRDQILDIDRTSRVLVPALKTAGYDVEYHEFDGRHQVSPPLLKDAVAWMTK